jgi:predicted transcriptional regulator of viral defense system
MKNDFNDSRLVSDFDEKLGGVFIISDLANMFAEVHRTALYRRIDRLVELGILSRFSRGIYISKNYQREILCQKLAPDSYISFGNVLADALVIGSRPDYRVDAVKIGKTRVYTDGTLSIRQFGCIKQVFFGYSRILGVQKASPEKAFLDTLYFYQHGARFHFDIYSDVNMDLLDGKKLADYLARYSNPKFVRFAMRIVK